MKRNKTMLIVLPLVLSGLVSCGVKTSSEFETSISALDGAPEGTFGIHVHTSTKYSPKLVASTLVFESINSKTKVKCSIIYNDYQVHSDAKDTHKDWFAQDPTTVFNFDSKKAAVLSYATDQDTGELPIEAIPKITSITGHSSDKFIYTTIYFKTASILDAIDGEDYANVKYFNVYQSKLNVTDTTPVTIQV